MKWQDYIEQRPDVMVGKPVFRGTRLPVQLILERLSDGWPEKDLLEAFPRLRPEHIRAALAYGAAAIADSESIWLSEAGQ